MKILALYSILPVISLATSLNDLGAPLEGCMEDCAASYEFCGTDRKCHLYTCENWILYGPEHFTPLSNIKEEAENEDKDSSTLLTCRPLDDRENPDTNFYNKRPLCESGAAPLAAVVYDNDDDNDTTTFPWDRYCADDPHQLARLPWDRKCTAKVGNEGFVCYDVAASSNALLEYEVKVNQLAPTVQARTTSANTTRTHYFVTELAGFALVNLTNPLEDGQQEEPVLYGFNFRHGMPSEKEEYDRQRAVATLRAERFEIDYFALPYCLPQGCPVGTFCGTDNACHALGDCQVFYEYGPITMTGRIDPDDAPSLNCTTEYQWDYADAVCGRTTDATSWPLAVIYDCSIPNRWGGFEHGCSRNYTQGRELPFHRMCTAEPNQYQSFVCFDTVGMPESDILAYEETILDDGSCSAENVPLWDAQEWKMTQNWTLCDQGGDYQCFRASHWYNSRVNNESYSGFAYPYPTRRDIYYNPPRDGQVVDRKLWNYSMVTDLSGLLPPGFIRGEGSAASPGCLHSWAGSALSLALMFAYLLVQ